MVLKPVSAESVIDTAALNAEESLNLAGLSDDGGLLHQGRRPIRAQNAADFI